jgi:protein-tyrosine-phosphatase
MPSILFVCTANRFRSPLVEAFFCSELFKNGTPGEWHVGSAGTWALPGLPPLAEAITAAKEMGLDISLHRSRSVNAILMREATLVLVMESNHKEALDIEFPEYHERIFPLTEVILGAKYDLQDPFITNEPGEKIARELFVLIRDGFMNICQWAVRFETGLNGCEGK